jgi:Domain of unknown function (DUF4398)
MVHILQSTASRRVLRLPTWTVLALVFSLIGGCASVPPPDGAMNQAQAQLQAARDAGAADYAPVDLDYAQSRFNQAQQAMVSRKYEQAAALADESRADSELARVKARLGAARAQVQAKTDENAHLRTQLVESHNDTAPAPTNVQETETVLPAPADSNTPVAGDDGQAQPAPTQNNQGGQP